MSVTLPASGSSLPRMILMSVDLPAPFGPTMAMRSPAITFNETSSNSSRPPNDLESPATVNMLCLFLQFFRRKQKRQRPPGPLPPIKFVVLARLRLAPFVPPQAGLFQFSGRERLGIHKPFPITRPADAPKFGGNLLGQRATIVAAHEILGSGIEID